MLDADSIEGATTEFKEPFVVDTQEGEMVISPKTVDDWDNGYYIAYPDDGSKPYAISPEYVRQNYELV